MNSRPELQGHAGTCLWGRSCRLRLGSNCRSGLFGFGDGGHARSGRSKSQGVRHFPVEHETAEPVPDRDPIEEAAAHWHIDGICAPHLIRPFDRRVLQQIRINLVGRLPNSPSKRGKITEEAQVGRFIRRSHSVVSRTEGSEEGSRRQPLSFAKRTCVWWMVIRLGPTAPVSLL
jgi:hypothetical protein